MTPRDAMENFQGLMEMCLGNNNPHAHYIQVYMSTSTRRTVLKVWIT
ncbi:unnamed protein product [Brassica oleracea var. botrytis]